MRKKKFFRVLKILLINLILIEVSIMGLVKLDVLKIIAPTYSFSNVQTFLPVRSYLYGYKHAPLSTYQIKKNCLNNHYRFNSLGFRGTEYTTSSSVKRVVVLGDSFMEGVGVEEDERLSNLLQKETGVPHLNFSMGDKGTTQSFVIYDSIASKYDHNVVLFSIYPTNDLIDDDPNYGKTPNSIRPCWDGEYPDYSLRFFPENAPKYKRRATIKYILKQFTYTYNALFFLKQLLLSHQSDKDFPRTGYFNYSTEQLNRMKYSILKLNEKAKSKKVIVMCIPSTTDLNQSKNGEHLNIEFHLKKLCEEHNIEFIGLYNDFKSSKNISSLFHTCDSHWTDLGHKKAKSCILSKSNFYSTLK